MSYGAEGALATDGVGSAESGLRDSSSGLPRKAGVKSGTCGKRVRLELQVGDHCSFEEFEEFEWNHPGRRLEYLEGVIVEKMSTPPHNSRVQGVRNNLTRLFRRDPKQLDLSSCHLSHSYESRNLQVTMKENTLVRRTENFREGGRIKERTVLNRLKPDIIIVTKDQYIDTCRTSSPSSGGNTPSPPQKRRNARGAKKRREKAKWFENPVMVIEVVSENETNDTVKKHRTYAKGGIVQYWMIIAKDGKREVRVCRLKRNRSEYSDTTYQGSEVIAGSMLSPFKMTANDVLSWNQPQEDDNVYDLLVAAQKKADDEQKKAVAAQKRADTAETCRDKEKKRADDEEKRADTAETEE